MGRTYKSARVTRPSQSIYIATPAYELVKPAYAWSLAMTTADLTSRGIPFEVAVMEGNCHVDDGRNSMVRQFLQESQCTELVFIDSDVSWKTEMFIQLISHDTEDIIAGAYPYKSFPQKFPVGKILNAYPNGLLEVSYAPTGFMRIPRAVFEKLIPTTTSRGKKFPTYRFFERRYTKQTYDGGDVTFCRKWIAMGGKVIVDPRLVLSHSGEYRWSGCFLDYLAKEDNKLIHTVNSKDPVPDFKPDYPQDKKNGLTGTKDIFKENPALLVVGSAWRKLSGADKDIAYPLQGNPTLDDFKALADRWSNKPWAATAEYIEMAYKMADNLPAGSTILECGSGISTIVLATVAERKGLHLITLEHTNQWQGRAQQWLDVLNLKVEFPLVNMMRDTGWYDYTPDFTPDLMVIDGPPGYIGGDRSYPLKQPWVGKAAVLMDDATTRLLGQLKGITGHWIPTVLGGRPACIGRAGIMEEVTV